MTLREYILLTEHEGEAPHCACGCGQAVSWRQVEGRFMTYRSGHNPSGFKVQQPQFTEEQVRARNEAIRAAYRRKGSEE